MRNWFKRAWAKIRRRKDPRPGDADPSPLREFIYLDEVSVYSLRASRQGAIKSEQTDSEKKEWRQRIDSELAASTPVAKAGVKSQFETGSSQETQVARKWLIQSTFKELVEHETHAMRIRSSDRPEKAPSDLKVEDLVKMSKDQGVLRCSTLKRGDLLELEIELAPEDVFTASQLVKAMFMFFEEMPDQFRLDRGTFELGKRLDSMFERLLVGLVPIRARIVGRQVLKVDGEQLLVSDHLFQAHPHLWELGPEPVYLVGVAE